MKALLRLLSCLVLVAGLASCEEDPISSPPSESFNVSYWLDSANANTVRFSVVAPKGRLLDSLYWDFGDSTIGWLVFDTTIVHTYDLLKDYRVIVRSDLTDSALAIDTLWVRLAPTAGGPTVTYQLDAADSLKVRFSVTLPRGSSSLELAFGDGSVETINDTRIITHTYPGPKEYYVTYRPLEAAQRDTIYLNLRDRLGSTRSSQLGLVIEHELISQDSMTYRVSVRVGPEAYGAFIDFGDSTKKYVYSDRDIVYQYHTRSRFRGMIRRLDGVGMVGPLLQTFDVNFTAARPPTIASLIGCNRYEIKFSARFGDSYIRLIQRRQSLKDAPMMESFDSDWSDGKIFYYEHGGDVGQGGGNHSSYHKTFEITLELNDPTKCNGRYEQREYQEIHYQSQRLEIEVQLHDIPFDHEDATAYYFKARGPICKALTSVTYKSNSSYLPVLWDDPALPEAFVIFYK